MHQPPIVTLEQLHTSGLKQYMYFFWMRFPKRKYFACFDTVREFTCYEACMFRAMWQLYVFTYHEYKAATSKLYTDQTLPESQMKALRPSVGPRLSLLLLWDTTQAFIKWQTMLTFSDTLAENHKKFKAMCKDGCRFHLCHVWKHIKGSFSKLTRFAISTRTVQVKVYFSEVNWETF